jgi:MFS family permease
MILLLVAFGSFAGDFGAAAGIPTIILQAEEWKLSPVVANYPNNLTAVFCGVSGILWMPLLNSWGRMPVLFWSTVLGLLFTLGAVLAPNFPTHYAFRALEGVTQSTGQTIGLAFIEDTFFFHQHARKIGIWYAIFICSPFMSPLFGNFIVGKLGEWRPVFWMVFAWAAFLMCMILIWGDETYYNRSVPVPQQPPRKKGYGNRFLRIIGVWQIKNHHNYFATIFSSYRRLLEVFLKPVIPITMLFYSAIFMWFIGITISSSILLETPISLGGYGLGPISVGYIFFTPIVGVLLGEAFGHWFNDYIVKLYGKRHNGLFVPEVRLWTTYLGACLMIPGLVLVGQTLKHHLSVTALVFGWGMNVVGVMLTSVATVAYVLDCYPTASGEVSALINMGRVACGFTVGYFQQVWGERQGFDVSFGLQAVVVACAFILLFFVQRFGARLRRWAGPVSHLKF